MKKFLMKEIKYTILYWVCTLRTFVIAFYFGSGSRSGFGWLYTGSAKAKKFRIRNEMIRNTVLKKNWFARIFH